MTSTRAARPRPSNRGTVPGHRPPADGIEPVEASSQYPTMVAATLIAAILMAAATFAAPVALAGVLAGLGLIVAVGFPIAYDIPSKAGASVAVAIPALLGPASVLVAGEGTHLQYVPVAVIAGMLAMFLQQLFRRNGRSGLVPSIAAAAFAIGIIAMGCTWLPAAFSLDGKNVNLVLLGAVAISSLVDFVGGRPQLDPWLPVLAALVGAASAAIGAIVLSVPLWPAAGAGALVAAIAYTVRRVGSSLAPASWIAQAAFASSGVMSAGVLAYLTERIAAL